MLQNHMTKIITNQKDKKFVSLFSNPIAGKTVVVVGTGTLGSSMTKTCNPIRRKYNWSEQKRANGRRMFKSYYDR